MHCVIQTEAFIEGAKRAGLSDAERHALVLEISKNPMLGELIPGTGGARKWRIPAKGKGKRGGARVISFFAAEDIPVFLLDVFSKGERVDLSKGERNELKKVLGGIAEDYRASVREKVSRLAETGS